MTPLEKYPADKKPKSYGLTRGGPNTNHPRARGLHPPGALARTLWKVNSDEIEKNPPRAILPESPEGSGTTVGT